MTEDAGWQFAERMAVDFHRSMELDELDQELFSQEEKTGLYVLAKVRDSSRDIISVRQSTVKRYLTLTMNWDDALKSWTRVTEKQMDSEEIWKPSGSNTRHPPRSVWARL